MTGIEGFIERTLEPERKEDQRIIAETEKIDEGGVKQVFEGLHGDIIMPIEYNEEIRKIYRDLHGKARVENTWGATQEGLDIFKQDKVPRRFEEAVEEYSLEHAVKETVEIFESFAKQGYAYVDLSPDNIRFHNGRGIAIDYLDHEAVEEMKDEKFSAALAYQMFSSELKDLVDTEIEQVEAYIDKYSSQVSAEEYTGNLLADFVFRSE